MGYLAASFLCAILVSLLIIRRGYISSRIEVIPPAFCCLVLSLYFAAFVLGWVGALTALVFLSLSCFIIYLSPIATLTTRYLPENDE